MTPGPKPGKAFLDRVTVRVWESAQHAPSEEAFDLASITLQVIGYLVKRSGRGFQPIDSSTTLSLLDLATIEAHGMKFDEWRRRNELRKSQVAWELARCIPDYDPREDRGLRVRA